MIKANKVYILVMLCVLFWSGNFVLGRFIKDDLEPLELAFFRWSFVFVFLLPSLFFVNVKNIISLIKSNFLIVSILAILSVTTYNTILYIALQTTTATNALLINSGTPMVILLLSFLILKTKIKALQVIGIGISTLGVIFLILKGELSSLSKVDFHEGDLWVMLSGLSWALYSVLLKFKPKGYKPSELFIANMYMGFLYLLPFYLYQGYDIQSEITKLQNYWYFFVYISLFASILSYIFWNLGVENLGAHKTGQFVHLMPFFGSILAYIFLGETLKYYHMIGAILIGFGIYISLFLKQKEN